MGDHGEVGEMPLYAGVQDGLGSGVAQRGPVLVQQVHQLLAHIPEKCIDMKQDITLLHFLFPSKKEHGSYILELVFGEFLHLFLNLQF